MKTFLAKDASLREFEKIPLKILELTKREPVNNESRRCIFHHGELSSGILLKLGSMFVSVENNDLQMNSGTVILSCVLQVLRPDLQVEHVGGFEVEWISEEEGGVRTCGGWVGVEVAVLVTWCGEMEFTDRNDTFEGSHTKITFHP